MIRAIRVDCSLTAGDNRTDSTGTTPLVASPVFDAQTPASGFVLFCDKNYRPLPEVRYLPDVDPNVDGTTSLGAKNTLQIQMDAACLRSLGLAEHRLVGIDSARLDASFQFVQLFRLVYYRLPTWDTLFQKRLTVFATAANRSVTRPKWMTLAIALVDASWNEPLPLTALAKSVGVNPVTVSKGFPKYVGCTLRYYVRQLRIKKAMVLLRSTNKNLTAIAYECGFSDQSHFSRTFRQLTGFRPKQFQKL